MPSRQAGPQNLEPDEAVIRQHLEALVAPAVAGPLADGLLEIAYGTTKPNKAHLFPLSDLHQAVEFAARVNRVGNQVYAGMAVRKPGTPIGKRSGKAAFYGSYWCLAGRCRRLAGRRDRSR